MTRVIFTRILSRMTRGRGLQMQALLFFVLALTAFVFGIGADPEQLETLIPGLVWAILVLSGLLGLPDLLEADAADGTLDDLLLSKISLPAVMAMKMAAHAAATTLPAAFAAVVCTAAMSPEALEYLPQLAIGLAFGALSFSAVGLLGAALTLGSRRAGTLLAVIVLPLGVPPLIFGAGAASAHLLGVSPVMPLSLLAAFCMAALTLAPFAAAAIVRMKVTTP